MCMHGHVLEMSCPPHPQHLYKYTAALTYTVICIQLLELIQQLSFYQQLGQ